MRPQRLPRRRPAPDRSPAPAAPAEHPAVAGASLRDAAQPPAGDAAPGGRAPWPDLSPLVDGSPPGRLPQKTAKLWSLVLRARRVPHRVRSLPGGYSLQTPARFARQAAEEIRLYQQENVSPHPDIPLPEGQERARATVAAMLALCAFYAVAHRPWPLFGWYPQYWHAVGVADAARLLHGEAWRALTALTLHADPAHIASNAVVGGAFLILLSRRAGSGLAWLCAILAGGLGNLFNAWLHALIGPGHLSVGFSTAVFGAAGVLAGLKAASGEGDFRAGMGARAARAWLAPVGAGLALLASLGTAGEDTDLGAHFLGFFAGLGIGAGLGGLARLWGRPDEWLNGRANLGAGAAAGLLLALAWAWGWLASLAGPWPPSP